MPKPFAVNPAVLHNIRPMRWTDVPRVAELHHAAMGKSLWAQLGQGFLREIYRALLCTNEFIAFVYEEEHQIEGFIAGSTHTEKMMQSALRQRTLQLTLKTVLGLRNPSVLKRLLDTPKYFTQSAPSTRITAESLFCSFTPKLRGKRISGHINKVLFDTLHYLGHNQVKITTETDNLGANRQLTSWGFENQSTFHFYDKEMVLYVLNFETSDRVQAQDWRHPATLANFQSN